MRKREECTSLYSSGFLYKKTSIFCFKLTRVHGNLLDFFKSYDLRGSTYKHCKQGIIN